MPASGELRTQKQLPALCFMLMQKLDNIDIFKHI
jgi:hypothetical protein